MPHLLPIHASLCLLLVGCASDRPRAELPWRLALEGNASWQTRNDARIPNDSQGTRFALDGLTGDGPYGGGRTTLEVDLDGRNGLRFVAAPLRVEGDGRFDQPVEFQGETYAAHERTRARYRFDTYRLTWRWLMREEAGFLWRLGVTLLVRDAEVELQQGETTSRDDDVGLVPLLHAAAEHALAERWHLVADVDAAFASQGRAIDLSLVTRYQASPAWDVSFGYRLLDGGADNDEVFSFATFHSLVVAIGWSF